MALQDSGVAGTPTSNETDLDYALSASRRDRREEQGECEDGDHTQYPSQESSTDSVGSSLVVGPQPSPLLSRGRHRPSDPARSDSPGEHLPRQAVPAIIAVNETNSSQISSGDSPPPCSTPNGAATVQYINVNVQAPSNSSFNFTGKAVGTSNNQGKQLHGLVQTDGQVAEFSCEFGTVTHEIMAAVKQEEREGRLLSIAAEMTSPDPNDSFFPGAAEAKTIEEFFQLGRKQKWWHWLDFERLILILEKSKCQQALEIIEPYMKKLKDHVEDRLSELDEAHPRDEGHWIEMKCQCDHANLTLKAIKDHKQFLVSRLQVPNLAFTYCHTYEGCIVTVWRIHSALQAAEVKKKLLAIEGCSKTDEPGREIFKAILYTPFPDLFAHIEQGTLDVDSLTEAHLCAVNESLHTLLSLAVKCNKPSIVEKLLGKGLSQKTKDFRATEMKQTAINIAAHRNYCACLKALLVHGCDPAIPDVAKKVALQYACSNNCVSCVKEICTAEGTTSLTQAGSEDVNLLSILSGQYCGLVWIRRFLDKPCFSEAIVGAIREAQARRQCEVVTPALFEAARSGDFSCITVVLEEGDDMNVKSEQGEWPLYVAALHGHLDVMQKLEECARGVQVVGLTKDGNTILHAAVKSHKAEVVEYALKHMAKEQGVSLHGSDVNGRNGQGESALELATLSGNQEIVKLLLRNGVHPCIPSSCGELLTSPNEAIQEVLSRYRKDHWLKIYTAMSGKKSPLKRLIQFWQHPYDHNLRSPYEDNMLMMAAREGKCDAVQFLLDSLKNISEEGVLTDFQSVLPQGDAFPGYQEHTHARRIATPEADAKHSSPVLQKYVLMVNPYDGYTAAHCAAARGKMKSLTFILECNPTCVGIQDKQGNTPLHIAAIGNHTACIRKLMDLASHADVSTLNQKGQYADELLNRRAHFWTLRGKLQKRRREHTKTASVSDSGDLRAEKGVASDDMAIDQGESCQHYASDTGTVNSLR